jgi:tRNA(Ile)-lysidine synthase
VLDAAKKLIGQTLEAGDKIAAAVSGGADSMCLASLLLERGCVDKNDILIVNVNHQIRAERSDSDSRFVKAFAARNGVKYKCFTADVPALAAQNGVSLETAAREARYGFLYSLIDSGAVKYVLTAHHAGDNTETVLMNLFRGSGLKGLCGMEILNGRGIFRPLLTAQKSEIEKYIAANKIEFVTDETNADNAYNRNFVRNEILPLIRSRWRGADGAIAAASADARAALERLKGSGGAASVSVADGGRSAELAAADLLDTVSGAERIFSALSALGAVKNITRKHIGSVLFLNDNRSVNLPNGLTAQRIGDKITLSYAPPKTAEQKDLTEIPFKARPESVVRLAGKTLKVTLLSIAAKEKPNADSTDYGSDAPCGSDTGSVTPGNMTSVTLCLNAAKIPNSAVWRTRRDGDIFKPYGGGAKKLKKYLIDKKIPVRERDALILLAIGNEVLAVAGVEISDLVKCDIETDGEAVLKIEETKT